MELSKLSTASSQKLFLQSFQSSKAFTRHFLNSATHRKLLENRELSKAPKNWGKTRSSKKENNSINYFVYIRPMII
jgi:hypothetical protein